MSRKERAKVTADNNFFPLWQRNRQSYMRASVLLNLLNKLRKKSKICGLTISKGV